MARKLPEIFHQDEFELMYNKVKEMEKTAGKGRRRRLQQYRLAMLLSFESGMRISEIVGLRELVSVCHNAKIIKKREDINGRKIIQRYCSECNEKLSLAECHRVKNAGWEVPPLTKDQIDFQRNSMKVVSGKGNKDRFVPLPKRVTEAAASMLPLKIKRCSLQRFVTLLGKEILKKNITMHTYRHCCSRDTEILTSTGWKKYNEIKKKEEIYTFNLKRNVIELKPIKEIYIGKYKGEMYHINNNYIDSLITPEHKVIVKYSTIKIINGKRKNIWTKVWTTIKIEDLMNIKSLRKIKCLTGNIIGLSESYISKQDITKQRYNGIVWCPSTDNKTFIARRKGKIFITGNSFATHFHEKTQDIRTLQVLLGHATLQTTAIYSHIDTTKAIEKAREVF